MMKYFFNENQYDYPSLPYLEAIYAGENTAKTEITRTILKAEVSLDYIYKISKTFALNFIIKKC